MNRGLIVPDASVILKWYLDEEGSHKAILLRDEYLAGDFSFLVPDFAYLEVANRLSREAPKNAAMLYEIFELLPHSYPLTHDDLARCYEFAIRERQAGNQKLTVYDASYVMAAQVSGAKLISADEPQVQAAKRIGCPAVLLKDYA